MADKKNTVSFDEWANGAEVKPAKTGILGRAGDLGLSALKSAISVPETAVGLANLVSGGKAGKAVESAGIRFKDAKDILDAQKSDAAKDAEWRFQNAEGFTGKLGAAVENPSLIANTLVESAAPMLAGGVVGRGLSMAAPRLAGYAGAIGEGAIGAGSAAEQIRQESTDGELSGKQAALAGASGLATGLLGYGGGKLADRFGVGDIDTALAGGARTAGVQAGKEAPGMLKRIGGGALSEGVFEELPQSVSEQVLQNVALDRDPMQGVDAAAAMGLLSGGLMGGGMGVVSGQPKQQAAPAQQPVAPGTTPVSPPASTPPAGPTLGQSLTGTPMADLMGGSGLTGGANPLQAGLSTLTSNNQMYPGMNTEPAGYTVDPETGAIIQADPVGARQMAEPVAQVEAPAPAAQAPVAPALAPPALGESLTGTPVADMLDTRTPSQRMGLNPKSGGLTAAAAIAVDSGASPVTAGMGLRDLSGASPASQPVAEESTQQQAQPPAQQPILNNGKPFTLAEVGKANQAIGGTAVSVPGGWAIQPPQATQKPAATPATAMPTDATPAASAQSAILGRNSQPIAEGGQPFATREEAKAEKRMQPLMRVAPAEGGGFILKPASERQLAAVEKAAKRLKYPSTGETGPRSLHGFILQIGGLASGTMPDIGFDLNPRVGNRRLFSPRGKTIEQAAMAAKQEGYIQDEDENTLIEALKRSLNVSPVYTPDGYEAMAEAQMQARYEDFLAAEQDGGAENDWSRLTPEELAETGYNDYDEATQAEIRALVAQAEALGIDAESILEDVAQRTENATQKDYENAAKSAIEAAIRSSEESRSRDLGQAGAEAGPATADTQAAPAAVTGPASDVRARNLAALKARMMGQKKPTPTTPPAQTKATPAPEAGPTNQGATNGQGQETLLKAEQPTGAAAMVSGAPVADTSLNRDSSWVIRDKATGKVVMETFDRAKVDALNATKYEAVPIQQHLAERGAKKPSDTTKPGGFTEKVRKAAGKVDAAPAQPILTSPTKADIESQQARAEQAEKSKAAQAKADAARAAKERERKDIAAASVAAADTFELGGDAMQNLTGQLDVFGAMDQAAKPVPPKATELTPKQFHEAKLAFIAADTGASMAEVRDNYDTEAGRAENQREWAGKIEGAAKAGEVLTRQTLDKLYELAPNARLPETAFPNGYQKPEARKSEAENKQARVDGRKAAKAGAKSERQKASDDLKAALGDLGDILSKNTRMNITAEQEQKLLPVLSRVMDAAFRLGYLKFKDAAKFALDKISEALGDDVANQITLDHMQGAYIAMAGKYQGQGADTKKAVVNIEDRAEIENHTAQAVDTEEESDAPDTNTSVERDSGKSTTEPAVGDTVQNGRRADATGDNQVPGQPSGSNGRGQPDGSGVQADGPVTDGVGGNLRLHSGDAKRDASVIATGAEFSERGSGIGNDGISAEPVPASQVDAVAQSSSEKNRLALKQKQADSIGLKYADLDNIKATLPMLLDGQQEDVFKAETRFKKTDGYGMLFTNGTGTGKAQPLDAKLMTPTGWKLMGDIKPGDQVVGVDGKPTNVLAVYPQGEKPIFRVTFSDGATTECCDEHLWETQTLYARRKASANPDWDCAQPKVRQLSEIRSTLNEQHFIPVASPLDLSATNLAIPPYIMGAILGDGCITQNTIIIASADPEIADRVTQDLPASMSLRLREDGKRCPQYRISLDDQVRRDNGQMEQHPWLRELRALGLHGCDSATKFVPESYLIGSIQQRTELLQGMLDTDGWVDAKSKSPYFTSISRRLVDAVAFLARSLGGTATINTKRPTYHYQGERRNGQIAYNVCLNLPDGIAPFTLSRKADIYRANTKYPPRRRIVGVEMVGTKPAQCIAVDHPRHLYVTDDCIVTHNTFTGLGIIKRMARQGKTNILVVVPDEKIGDDWIGSAKLLGLNVSKLADTKDAGKGIVLTTYANLGSNDALATRAWDLVVADEAHNLMKSADGTVTTYLQNLRAITMHPDGAFQRYAMLNREKIDRSKALGDEIIGLERMIAADSTTDQQRAAWDAKSEALQKELGALRGELDKALSVTRADVKANQGAKRTRLAALSATPFAYEFTIDWANGYLFDYNDGQASDETESRGYNSGSNRERFFMQHFGYSMRYNKLTKPDPTKVDTGLMQRSFNTMLKKAGSLSGRMLDVKADYDRRFVLVDSAIGNQIDEALNWISDMAGDSVPGFSTLRDVIGKKFDYLSRRYLLEAIKAKEAVPIVRKHMEMGRKVVVFHDYKKGGGFNPFNVSMGDAAGLDSATEDTKALAAAIDSFKQKFAALVNTPFQSLLSPIEVFSNEFPGVLLINGDEKKADLLARYKAFQDDATGPQVALVQSAKNAGWSGHDTTGKHQRVLINLGQPTAPTLAIQQEGRIYRTGQVSNAIMRYMNTGTNWEKWAFATTIAGRASAAENLGMGELSRALKDSFIGAFEESDAYPPGHEGEGTGGKERDAAQNNQLTAWDRAKSLYWATQKKNSRTKAQEGVDYFATPEPVGMKMAEWLGSRGGERTLEPSAGHGAIARWLPETTKRTVIEPSNTLRSRLALVMNPSDDRILDVKFEALDAVNKFDGIAMNPPFGVGGKTAIEHLAKAATHLSDGGRIVALIPTGPAADKRFDQWMYGEQEAKTKPLGSVVVDGKETFIYKGDTIELQSGWAPPGVVIGWRQGVPLVKPTAPEFRNTAAVMVDSASIKSVKETGPRTEKYRAAKDMYTVGEVLLPSVTFERAGTAVSTRIVVLEKQSKAENAPNQKATIDLSSLSDINDLFERMENLTMPERKMTEAQKAEVEAEQKQAEASAVKTERNEAAKKQSAAVGDKVTLAGKEYDVVVYTTNAGKDIRGAWVKTKELATRFNDRTFQKKPLGWFVREKDFHRTDANQKPSVSRAKEQPLTPAPTIRASIEKAYGSLLSKLEAKGLVTIAQTEREAIEAAAQARADKTGGDVDAISSRMMSLAGVDAKYSANGNIEGFFDKQTGKSFLVADNLTAASAPGTLMHEVGIHMAAGGKLEPLFKRAGSLLKTGTQNEFIQRVKARMARAGETSDEEAAAYITTEYERDRTNAPVTVSKWLADLTAEVRAWLFSKGIILKAEQLTVADIAAVARANAKSMARGGVEGGVKFSRTGGTDQTMTEAFKRWFKGSKVVDAEGKPLVVYHGTENGGFSVFGGSGYGSRQIEKGIWFSDESRASEYAGRSNNIELIPPIASWDDARRYADSLNVEFSVAPEDEYDAGNYFVGDSITDSLDEARDILQNSIAENGQSGLYPVYLKINKPKIINAKGKRGIDVDVDVEQIKANGFDGIIIKNVDDPGRYGEHGYLTDNYVVFSPEQIKSATGNNGAFSAADPDIRFSRAADMAGNAIDKAKQTADKAMGKDFPRAASMPDLNDDQRSLLGKVGASQSPASDAIKAATDRAGLKIRQGMVDRFAALKELDEKALGQNFIADSITNSAWALAKMSSAGSGALNAMMKSGRIEMDATQKVIGLKGAPNGGLTASLQKLGGPAEVERFFAWVAANRSHAIIERNKEAIAKTAEAKRELKNIIEMQAIPGKTAQHVSQLSDARKEWERIIAKHEPFLDVTERLFTDDEVAAGRTLNTGTTEEGRVRPALYSQVHTEFQQYRDDVLAIAEQAGIINSENRAMWRDEFYVPFYRVMGDDADRGRSGGNGLSRQEAYKKLKGGKQNLNDLMENTLMNFHHLLSASLKNQAAVQAIKNAEAVGIARKVPEARRDTKTSTFVLVDGKKVFYEVDDPLVFESITTLADPGLNNTAVRVMGAFKRLFTNMTTATPQFIIANTFRDLLQASATSPTSKNIAKNLKEGIQSYRDEKTRAEMLASGGAFSFGHIYGMGADEVKASLQKTVAGAGLISSPSMIPSILRKGWDAWGDITDLSENASRAATYTQNVDELGKLRAAFEARDVMDFSQHGAWPAVRLLVRIVPFLNARLQGLDKLYRSGLKPSILTAMGKGTDTDKQAAARFAMVTGALTLATMALYMMNADDDEYKKLEEWQKDTYWFIRVGENAFFLPKPFEVGAIATMAERTLQQAMDDKATGKLFKERMWEMLMQTFAFNPTPQMFQPLVDVYANKDAFTGRDIETAGMERMSAGLRSRDSTTAPATALSAISRVFGDESAVAISPVQADHLIKGYLGGVGATGAAVLDTMFRTATGQSSPDKAWSEYQPIRRFYRDLEIPVANTRYTTLFYDGLKESNRVYADVMELQKLGRTEEAESLAAEKRNPLQMHIALNAQQRRLTEINNRMKEVRRSDKDGEWKRRELDLLNTQKAMITERMGKRIEDARVGA